MRRLFFQLKISRRLLSTNPLPKQANGDRINSWQIHSYGGLEELQFTRTRQPIIKSPNDVLVKVLATSVNPLDVAMINGYGSEMLNLMRQVNMLSTKKQLEFPLTLGRDFAGIVIQKGHSSEKKFAIGEEVWGVVPPHWQGSHADMVVVSDYFIEKKPSNISMVEAGSMLFAAITAWSALETTGRLTINNAKGKTVLVIGSSGGVGTMAVQILRNWGANVIAVCSEDAIPLLNSLGIDDVIDYKAEDAFEKIGSTKYDIILDCAGLGTTKGGKYCQFLKVNSSSIFITLQSPVLKNVDHYGVLCGMMKNLTDLLYDNVTSGCIKKSSSVRWAFFLPLKGTITEITKYVEEGKMTPCVQKTYSFEDVPKAYEHVSQGHLRGKIVIDLSKKGDQSEL